MRYLNDWHHFETIGFDLVKITVAMPGSSDLGATKTASTKTKSKSTSYYCATMINVSRSTHGLFHITYIRSTNNFV